MNVTEINAVIDNVCAKLEIPVQKGFEYLSALGAMNFYWAVVGTIFSLLCVVIIVYCMKAKRALNKYYDDGFGYEITIVIAGAVELLCVCATVHTWYSALLYLISPEAWCISYLMDKI